MAKQERSEGNTPNGGVASIIYYKNSEGTSVDKVAATHVEIVELDEEGRQVFRTYGQITPEKSV